MSGLESNKKIVISGINLYQGGPLSIYYDFLDELTNQSVDKNNDIIAFVYKTSLFEKYFSSSITFIEIPKSRKSYIFRMYYEYVYFKKWSRKKNIDIWISLHDITPSVNAKRVYTYCHNPSPFRKISFMDLRTGLKNVLFPLFYNHVYKKNIKKASGIIVQQEWLRKEFIKKYGVKNVIVALPRLVIKSIINTKNRENVTAFFYPSFPRSFKNFEVICKATKKLNSIGLEDKFRVWLTINGQENKYARIIFNKYKNIKNIEWLGVLSRDKVFDYYQKTSCLVFPSKIETWGLPISEFETTNKGILAADLAYSRETVGTYDNVSFFNPDDSDALAGLMKRIINNDIVFEGNSAIQYVKPFAKDWKELLDLIINNEDNEA